MSKSENEMWYPFSRCPANSRKRLEGNPTAPSDVPIQTYLVRPGLHPDLGQAVSHTCVMQQVITASSSGRGARAVHGWHTDGGLGGGAQHHLKVTVTRFDVSESQPLASVAMQSHVVTTPAAHLLVGVLVYV